jgi:CheY-like chemotaxis protein
MMALLTNEPLSLNLDVLVVDNHLGVLTMLETVLRHFGLVVLFADAGEAAVEVFRQHAQTVAVVLLEVQMSGLDGPQTLAALRQIDPHVRCCFMSASTGKYTDEELLAMGAAHVFDKPFRSIPELAGTLRKVALSGAQKL